MWEVYPCWEEMLSVFANNFIVISKPYMCKESENSQQSQVCYGVALNKFGISFKFPDLTKKIN